MAIIDADWWTVRRKLGGSAGASYAASAGPLPVYEHRVPYVRRKGVVCQGASRAQLEARARWAYICWAWRNVLGVSERSYWNSNAEYVFGAWHDEEQQYRHLTGYEWFCALNARVLAAGLPLLTDADDTGPGMPLYTLEVEVLTSRRIRVAWTPSAAPYWVLALYGRGPMSVGEHAVVPEVVWWRHSVPSRWYVIGFSALAAGSPVEFDLPRAIGPGRKLATMGALMDYSGMMPDDWLVEQVVA